MNLENIAFTSARDTDKIVFTQTGSATISALPVEYDNGFGYVIRRLTLNHSLPRPVFVDFRFSTDGGATYKTGGSSEAAIGYSNSSTVNILILPDLTGTFIYEVFGSWIDDYDNTNPYVSPVAIGGSTYFDSRLNYRKVILNGSGSINDPTYAGASTTIPHTLDHRAIYSVYFESRPNEVWQEHAGGSKNPWAFDPSMVECTSYSDTTNIGVSGYGVFDYWYKVYGDE